MKNIIIMFASILVMQSYSVNAKNSEIISSLKKKYDVKSTIELSFDMDIFWSVREKHEKKAGHLQLAPDDKFRLKLGSTEWISNGHTYWQFNTKTKQVIIKDLLDVDLSMHPSQMIKAYLSRSYTVTSQSEKEATLVCAIDEDKKRKSFKSITLIVDLKKLVIKEMVVVDTDDNKSTYTFKKTKFNQTVPNELFTFKTPKGVEVLDTRE